MVPTIITVPSPFTTENRTEATTKSIRVTINVLSPPSSAPFLIIVSLIRVFSITIPSHAEKIATMIASPKRSTPACITVCKKPTAFPSASVATAGTPPMIQIPTARTKSARTVGILRVTIRPIINSMNNKISIPCSITYLSFVFYI